MRNIALILVLASTGCAGFTSKQTHSTERVTQYDLDSSGRTNRITVTDKTDTGTDAYAKAFAAGKSALDGYRASNSDKAQTASIKAVDAESDASNLALAMAKMADSFAALAVAIKTGGLIVPKP